MRVDSFLSSLKENGITFFTGVPDSQLKALCDYLNSEKPESNITTANEGNAAAIAAGYYMATKNVPCVYLQNSGLGNIINPYASLLHEAVYAIPTLFVIGWRGEPNVHDEPQHIFQGKVTTSLLETLEIPYVILTKETTEDELSATLQNFCKFFAEGKSCAVVVKKGALTNDNEVTYKNENTLRREDIIRKITEYSKEDIIVSTTGKTSRELFEIREANKQPHKYDFLTVGSMGHSSSIALGIALNKPNSRIWCVDGDGAVLMHMGSMALIGANCPSNYIHVVINNGAHETVGGMPTVASKIDIPKIALACGYKHAVSVTTYDELDRALENAKNCNELTLIEAKCNIGARDDLGRPKTTPVQNKMDFMNNL